ncbi:hypothetical protein AEP_03315 [Curvibacter sp. AEP1-3]|uniref:DUF1993 domain-containing protein n=1 Tax=Curvibacter sp. AEP1-3 TaxID=1844971 RepID=UPI000B3CFB79|nr:DUF1993 domain-containing protein [Curvibacter sp. AEP1-3]ARV20237.1 hypothetical protein AEP_03315 [Curvibacter sp. AEP1-3]
MTSPAPAHPAADPSAAPSALPLLFTASVPVFARYLGQLQGLLSKAAAHCVLQCTPEAALLQARLAPDMLPLGVQVEIAVNFVFRACAPLAGQPVPPFGEHRESLAKLQARAEAAQAFLHTLQPEDFAAAAERIICDPAGETTVALDGSTFLQQYALPNFFFHLSMVYALLRQQGLPLSKGDFDGWHVYRG